MSGNTHPQIDPETPLYLKVLEKYENYIPEDVLLKAEEAAILVEQTPKTLESWRCDGKELKFVKLGRLVRYRLSDILAYRNRLYSSAEEAKLRNVDSMPEWL